MEISDVSTGGGEESRQEIEVFNRAVKDRDRLMGGLGLGEMRIGERESMY